MSDTPVNREATSRSRRTSTSVLVGLLLVAASLLGVTGLFITRGTDPSVSSEWPRPFDPAKPFNMLGVPGVSVEQRKRAEDLLVRSLEAAPRWADYGQLLQEGWSSLQDQALGFEHLIHPESFYDGRMLDPLYPESLVYKVKGDERVFVAYMFIAEPGLALEDRRVEGFAGRLMEWHNHSDVCWRYDDEQPIGGVAGFKLPDGSCPLAGTGDSAIDPRVFGGAAPEGTLVDFGSFLMTHVWVVERLCGPFSALEGPSRGVTATPLGDRTDVCRH